MANSSLPPTLADPHANNPRARPAPSVRWEQCVLCRPYPEPIHNPHQASHLRVSVRRLPIRGARQHKTLRAWRDCEPSAQPQTAGRGFSPLLHQPRCAQFHLAPTISAALSTASGVEYSVLGLAQCAYRAAENDKDDAKPTASLLRIGRQPSSRTVVE